MSRSIDRLSQMGFTTSRGGGNIIVNGSGLTRQKGEDVGLPDIIRRLRWWGGGDAYSPQAVPFEA